MIDRLDVGWIAGFLEGEGSFLCPKAMPRMSATQIQRAPLDRLRLLIGGYIWVQVRQGKDPVHRWGMTNRNAAAWMMMLYTLMSPRRQRQIVAALTKWKNHKRKAWEKRLRARTFRRYSTLDWT